MATELRTFIWCDVHLTQKDEQVEGRPWALSAAPDQKPNGVPLVYTVDLCGDCADDLGLDHLRTLIDEYGMIDGKPARRSTTKTLRKAAAPARAKAAPKAEEGEPLTCPDCGEVFVSRTRLGSHGRGMHGKTIAELLGEPAPYVCEDCGSAFGIPQALARHRFSAHG